MSCIAAIGFWKICETGASDRVPKWKCDVKNVMLQKMWFKNERLQLSTKYLRTELMLNI